MRTGDRTVCKVTRKWEEYLGTGGLGMVRQMCTHVGSKRRKAHPALGQNNGMHFPRNPTKKKKDPFAEVLVNSRWRGRESRPRAARTDRCGAYAPCELRWQTLTRLLSSAPSRGSIPCGGCIKKGPLCRGPSQFKVAGKGIASARCADGPLRRLRALRAALANAYAFTQLRALTGFDSMWGLHKKRTPLQRS